MILSVSTLTINPNSSTLRFSLSLMNIMILDLCAVFTCFFVSPDGPKRTSVYSSPSGEIKEGSSVALSCSSDANPAATYTWFKEHEVSVKETGQNYTITNITSELGGNYYCQAHNAIGHQNSTFLIIKGNF